MLSTLSTGHAQDTIIIIIIIIITTIIITDDKGLRASYGRS